MNSALYFGEVRHRREEPRPHHFRYRIFMVYLDLSEREEVFGNRLLWSDRRVAPARFRRSHYLGDPSVPLEEAVKQLVAREGGVAPRGPIRMLTHLEYFGYCFNPVTFYYCFAPDGIEVETIVAEITNTPWDERHAYVLPCTGKGNGRSLRFRFDKAFHVSPFLEMNFQYDWRFSRPGRTLAVHMENRQEGRLWFDATLVLRRREISSGTLNAALLRFPWMTAKVVGAIYWQALLLWLKRMPFHAHPQRVRQEIPTREGK